MQTFNKGAAQAPALPLAFVPLDALDGLTLDQVNALAWKLSPFDADRRAVLSLGLVAWVNSQKGA